MTVRIVTDSTSDLPLQVAEAPGIAVVPAYVHFGDRSYRDGVDISEDEFYQKLLEGLVYPASSAPSPGDFAEVCRRRGSGGMTEEATEAAFLAGFWVVISRFLRK